MDEAGYTAEVTAVEPNRRLVAALLTPPGRGALAVVGLSGAGAAAVVDRLFTPRGPTPVAERADGAICFGAWHGHAGDAREDVVVVRRAADRIEVQCHGGQAAPESVLAGLAACGAVRVRWPEWLEATGVPRWAVEVRSALAAVGGPKAAGILARQLAGAWPQAWQRLLDHRGAGDAAGLRLSIDRLLRAARVGLRLTRPWRVVLAGDVNAGKSSLVNALAGHTRSIVTPLPGTTRDLVETRIVLDGWEVDLVDTAGLRAPAGAADPIEQAGIERALAAAAAADLVLRIVPADTELAADIGPGELLVLSKGDRTPTHEPERWPPHVLTSAHTRAGIDALVAEIVARLVPEEHREPDLLTAAVPITPRQVAALQSLLPPDPVGSE